MERDLGDVEIVQVHWLYDHEVDPFDLGKICLLFCSDRLFTDRLVVSTVGHSDKRCLHIVFLLVGLHLGTSGRQRYTGAQIVEPPENILLLSQFLLDFVVREPSLQHMYVYKP